MSTRYRAFWSRFSRLTYTYRNIANLSVHKFYYKPKPMHCVIGFSMFTWLGFDKKISAEDDLILTIKHCVLFIQRGEYDKAEQLLHVALRQAQQINHQLGITYIYDIMANLALEREHLDKAKQLFVAVSQRIMADGASEDDPKVVHISVKLARISHLQKQYSTAQLGFDWCLDKLSAMTKNNSSQENVKFLAMTEDWYGRLFLDVNQCEQGLKLMLSSLEKMKQIDDIEKEHIVVQLNDIGTVYDRLNKNEESINYFQEAINLAKPLEMEDLGAMHVNLGRVYLKTHMFDEARKNCGQAWKLGVMHQNKNIKNEAESCINQIKNMN